MLRWSVEYWAGGVGAKSAERHKRAVRWMQQEARMLVIRVGDDFHAANGDVSQVCHNFDRVGILSRTDENHESAEGCDDAGGRQIFRELAPGELLVLKIPDETSPRQQND
jgi:hypothetical protein